MSWLRRELAELPARTDVSFGLRAGTRSVSYWPSLYAATPDESPGWLRIGAYVPEHLFADPHVQRVWLDVLRPFAERLNPGFGQIEYGFDTEGTTALEDALDHRVVGLPHCDPEYTVGESRHLRGYSWLTVVPTELADRLGGVPALQATGAFTEVAALAQGGVWLLATDDWRDYGPSQVSAVFHALAPILRPGPPTPDILRPGQPPRRLIFTDAAEFTRTDDRTPEL